MAINLDKLIGTDAAQRLSGLGLHKVAAARLRAEGYDVPEELDIYSAVRVLGTRAFQKNAEYQSILQGLIALEELEKTADWRTDMTAASRPLTDAALQELQEKMEAGETIDPRQFLRDKGLRYLGAQQWLNPTPEEFKEQYAAWQAEHPGQIYFDNDIEAENVPVASEA